MTIEALLVYLAVGAVSGWLAGLIALGGGLGLIGDIVIGIVGSAVADVVLPRLGFSFGGEGLGGHILNAAIGGVMVLVVIKLIRRV